MPDPPEPPEQPDLEVVNRRVRKNPLGLPSAYCPARLPVAGKKWRWRKKALDTRCCIYVPFTS